MGANRPPRFQPPTLRDAAPTLDRRPSATRRRPPPHTHTRTLLFSWTNRGKGLLLLYLLVLLCATNWVVVKTAQADLPSPAAFTAARFAVAAAAFVPFLPRATRASWTAGLELGLWSALGYGTQAAGLLTCEASRAAFLSAGTVVVVPLLSGLTPGVRVPLVTWACAVAAMVGVYLLAGGGVPARPARIGGGRCGTCCGAPVARLG